MANLFKENVRTQLIIAAQEYFNLLDKKIILESCNFEYQKRYVLRFEKGNFLHLTGVLTMLKAEEFFNKCLDDSISTNDFDFNEIKNKTNIKYKLRCLVDLSSMFKQELLVQEQFVKNKVSCKIAASDKSFTIGFAGGEYCIYPKTILNKNKLDETKPILTIVPIVDDINKK